MTVEGTPLSGWNIGKKGLERERRLRTALVAFNEGHRHEENIQGTLKDSRSRQPA